MRRKKIIAAVVSAVFILAPLQLSAQQTYKQLPITVEAYVKPFAPLRIVGNLYNAQLDRERQAKAKSY